MRLRQSAALLVAAATSVLAFPAVQSSAATTGDVLYVNHVSGCSQTDGGTEAHPFCTISAAAAVVVPGQTVKVGPGSGPYVESVKLTRSGTPEQPITFLGLTYEPVTGIRPAVAMPSPTEGAFVLAGVHDVAIRGFGVQGGFRGTVPLPAVVVSDSSRITLDQNRFSVGGLSVRTAGDTRQVTVSRNTIGSGGIDLGAGTHDTLITGNDISYTSTVGVTATDAPNTAVTYNTIVASCGESVHLDGASPGALIENNVISDGTLPSACPTDPAAQSGVEVSVSAGSVSGSKVDYNLLHRRPNGSGYAWGGQTYPSAAAFTAATGQAGHDVALDSSLVPYIFSSKGQLSESAAAAIDSADPDAPGVEPDLLGVGPGDDPDIANTAPKGGIRDRGAYEVSGQRGLTLDVTADVPTLQGPAPFTVKATAAPYNAWGVKQADYYYDFGDGTTQHATAPAATHTYTAPGTYWVRVIVTDAQGGRLYSEQKSVVVNAPAELQAGFSYQLDQSTLSIKVTPFATSPYVVSAVSVDFGDGSLPASLPPNNGVALTHQYSAPGRYQVRVTAFDQGKRTVTTQDSGIQVDNDAYAKSIAPGERVQLLTQRADGSLINAGANYTTGRWSPFLPLPSSAGLPGTVAAAASVLQEDDNLHAYAVVDGKVYGNMRFLNQAWGPTALGTWDQWREQIGTGPLPGISRLTATAIGNETHLLAVANGRVYETYPRNGRWQPWADVTGALGFPADATDVAASSIGRVLHVAVLGSDGRIRIADGDYNAGRWTGGDLTAAIGSPGTVAQVAAATTPGSKFHVVARTSDGRVFEATGDYAAGRWSRWGDVSAVSGLPGVRQVAVASTGNSLRVFGVTSQNSVLTVNGDYTAGRWSAAARIDTADAAGPLSPFVTNVGIGPLVVAGR
ncbi:PKD domain-containing protein [Kitasatospora sp. SolWspMP-SS2h]|uniref:PKD domain-containing protein n=1 Tax=Kitasatospora sp. SolWspMP-SS2h TaxID=1305729 RepID=UPI000DBFFF88|nr:PKD domain-containing protein [Kitasatospora sp. SolWspMP-SS2h]RAJ35938.1 PKD domain-containing protein [Kitasatospora sp. SolWspMP-SS2h]